MFRVLGVQGAGWSDCCVFRLLGYSVCLECWVFRVFRVFRVLGVRGV